MDSQGERVDQTVFEGDRMDQKAGQQLNAEIIPGTEVMRDVGGVHFAHAGGAQSGSV